MCTAIHWKSNFSYFGRNLDIDRDYGEAVTVAGRHFPFLFRNQTFMEDHYAMMGMAKVSESYPLFFDAVNENGLSIAGLDFPDNAVYHDYVPGKYNITPFELIPWILCQCKSVAESIELLKDCSIWACPFNEELPLSPLHWLLADEKECVVLEPLENGLTIVSNPVGVLTNNPPFSYHMYHMTEYLNLTSSHPVNRFSNKIHLKPFSYGMGGIGLPGDLSSSSRFIKASFSSLNAEKGKNEAEDITQFFHLLDSVNQTKGLNRMKNGIAEYTKYSACCNMNTGVYYYTTYGSRTVAAVTMRNTDLCSAELITFPLICDQQINYQN